MMNSHLLFHLAPYRFDSIAYSTDSEQDDYLRYLGLPTSQWAVHLQPYLSQVGTNYALFSKNKYGYAFVKHAAAPKVLAMEQYVASLVSAYSLTATYEDSGGESALLTAHDVWDVELNKIYGMLREKLPPQEMDALRDEQRQWIAFRDNLAGTPEKVGTIPHWETRLYQTMHQTFYLADLYYNN